MLQSTFCFPGLNIVIDVIKIITSWEKTDVCTRMNVCSSENISIVVINALMLYTAILNSASFQHVQIA